MMADFQEVAKEFGGNKYQFYDVAAGTGGSSSGGGKAGGTSDVVVVLVHGIAVNKDWMLDFIPEFSLRYRVIVPDMPGHNGISLDGIENLDDMAEYLEGLIVGLGLKKYVVIGYSLGSLVTSKYAENFASKDGFLGAVVWAGPLLGAEGLGEKAASVVQMVKKMPENVYYLLQRLGAVRFGSGAMDLPLREVEVRAMSEFGYDEAKSIFKMIEEEKYEFRGDVKMLCVYGTNDPFVNEKNYEYLKGLAVKDMEVVLVENGGHFGSEEGWQEVFGKMREFVADLEG